MPLSSIESKSSIPQPAPTGSEELSKSNSLPSPAASTHHAASVVRPRYGGGPSRAPRSQQGRRGWRRRRSRRGKDSTQQEDPGNHPSCTRPWHRLPGSLADRDQECGSQEPRRNGSPSGAQSSRVAAHQSGASIVSPRLASPRLASTAASWRRKQRSLTAIRQPLIQVLHVHPLEPARQRTSPTASYIGAATRRSTARDAPTTASPSPSVACSTVFCGVMAILEWFLPQSFPRLYPVESGPRRTPH